MTTSERVHHEHATSAPPSGSETAHERDDSGDTPTPPASVSTRTALLTLRDLVVRDRSGRTLLDVPELDVLPGQRIVLTGRSGSGKSLLLGVLTGRTEPSLRVTGSREARLPRIGVVPQRGLDALHPLVPLARQLRAVTGATPDRVAAVLDGVGLGDPALHRRRPAELSGGQAQRAAVALAALTRAPLIVADEPTSALDPASRDRTLQLLESVVDETQTLVVATHDTTVAALLGDRHLRMTGGVLTEASGPARRDAPATMHAEPAERSGTSRENVEVAR